ncbi:hypothetical protein STEG23_008453, partial [Scotinomys teguina]
AEFDLLADNYGLLCKYGYSTYDPGTAISDGNSRKASTAAWQRIPDYANEYISASMEPILPHVVPPHEQKTIVYVL